MILGSQERTFRRALPSPSPPSRAPDQPRVRWRPVAHYVSFAQSGRSQRRGRVSSLLPHPFSLHRLAQPGSTPHRSGTRLYVEREITATPTPRKEGLPTSANAPRRNPATQAPTIKHSSWWGMGRKGQVEGDNGSYTDLRSTRGKARTRPDPAPGEGGRRAGDLTNVTPAHQVLPRKDGEEGPGPSPADPGESG